MIISPLFFALFALTVFNSCSSDSSTQEDTYLMTVKEYKTNIPLAGVKISLYKCTNYDNEFGCQSKAVFATHFTDQNGQYAFTSSKYSQVNEGIILSKSQYWDMQGNQGEIPMEPEAIVNLTLKTSNAYPDKSLFQLKTTGELGSASFETFIAPKDSTFSYRLFGNEINTINWIVLTKELGCYQYCDYDTIASGSFILNPKKFETLNSSVDY
ncbi:hypothetical protein [Pricia sp.]|uniref:hypothetical protein n=1 Tax=Pricia sp. TaxID=2268138 RepID=UPI0035930F21